MPLGGLLWSVCLFLFRVGTHRVTETLTARCAARLSDSNSDIVMDRFNSSMESVFTKLEELTEEQGLLDQDKEYIYQVFNDAFFHTNINSKNDVRSFCVLIQK